MNDCWSPRSEREAGLKEETVALITTQLNYETESGLGDRTTGYLYGQLSYDTESNDEFNIPLQQSRVELLMDEDDEFYDIEEEEKALLNRTRAGMPSGLNRSFNEDSFEQRGSVGQSSVSSIPLKEGFGEKFVPEKVAKNSNEIDLEQQTQIYPKES